MFNEVSVGTVVPFRGSDTPDKNGKMSIMILPVAGRIPNVKQVISGTVADNIGIEVGKTYLLQCREQGTDAVHGIDFTWLKLGEVGPLDVIDARKKLGEGQVVVFTKPENNYERKSVAVEGQRTIRIKEGLYKPATPTTVTEHQNADVKEGTSVDENVNAGDRKSVPHGNVKSDDVDAIFNKKDNKAA